LILNNQKLHCAERKELVSDKQIMVYAYKKQVILKQKLGYAEMKEVIFNKQKLNCALSKKLIVNIYWVMQR
jgi:hypothetical protein